MKAGGISEGPQEAEHPEWKSKLSLFAASWSQMLKCNRERKGCWEAVQEHSVSAGKSNQMQQECDLFSERWEAQLLGHMRRLKMRLKSKLTVWVRGISPVWSFLMYLEGLSPTLPELAQVALEALGSSGFEGSLFRAGWDN